jgi:hypothetical protein
MSVNERTKWLGSERLEVVANGPPTGVAMEIASKLALILLIIFIFWVV